MAGYLHSGYNPPNCPRQPQAEAPSSSARGWGRRQVCRTCCSDMEDTSVLPPHCPSVPSPHSTSCPRGPITVCSWPLWPVRTEMWPAGQGQGLRQRSAHLGWLPRGRLRLGEGAAGRVTCICRHCHCAGCIQSSPANALAAGGRLLLSPNSSTQSIINISPKAPCRHYRGGASHSGIICYLDCKNSGNKTNCAHFINGTCHPFGL